MQKANLTGQNKINLTITLKLEVKKRLYEISQATEHRSMGRLINQAIDEWLERYHSDRKEADHGIDG